MDDYYPTKDQVLKQLYEISTSYHTTANQQQTPRSELMKFYPPILGNKYQARNDNDWVPLKRPLQTNTSEWLDQQPEVIVMQDAPCSLEPVPNRKSAGSRVSKPT